MKYYRDYDELPMMLTPEDLAVLMFVKTRTIYDWIKAERIQAIKIGKQFRIPKEWVKKLLDETYM